jgi:hypothetical protein
LGEDKGNITFVPTHAENPDDETRGGTGGVGLRGGTGLSPFALITIVSPSPFMLVFLRGRVRGQEENERCFHKLCRRAASTQNIFVLFLTPRPAMQSCHHEGEGDFAGRFEMRPRGAARDGE